MPGITTSASRLVVSKSSTKADIACSGAACAGSVEVLALAHKKGAKPALLAKGSYSLAEGKSGAIALHLSNAGKKTPALARHHRASVKLEISVKGGKSLRKTVQLSLATKIVRR